jgi:hypothetical protein
MAYDVNSVGTGTSTSGSSLTITVPAGGIPAGSVIVVAVSDRTSSYGSQGVSDSAGNSYARAAGTFGLNVCGAFYYAFNVSALTAGQTITITKAGTDHTSASAVYITGTKTTDPINAGATATANATSASQPSVTSGTPSVAGCLFLAMAAVPGATGVYTADSNWATPPLSVETGTGGADREVDGGHLTDAGTSTHAFNPSYSAAPAAWAAVVIAIEPAGGGGTAITLPQAIITATGHALTLNRHRALTPPQASISWTGRALQQGGSTVITLARATIGWTGHALAINAHSAYGLVQAAITWAGTSMAVNAKRSLVTPAAALRWVGEAPALNAKMQIVLRRAVWRWRGRAFQLGALVKGRLLMLLGVGQ